MGRVIILDSGLCFGLTKNLSDVLYVNMSSNAFEGYERFVGYGCDNENVKVGFVDEFDIERADCILITDNSISHYIEGVCGKGRNVIYPSVEAAYLEFYKSYLIENLEDFGIKVVKRKVCNNYSELVKVCEEFFKWRCVIKIDKFELKGLMDSAIILSMNDFVKWSEKMSKIFGNILDRLVFAVSEYYEEGDFVEYGLDMLVENGRVKKPYLVGRENGRGYLSEVTDVSLSNVVSRFEELFDVLEYNCAVSVELFVFGDGSYAVSDVNMRFGMPFSLMYPVVIENWEELLCGWNDGVKPYFRGRFVGGRIEEVDDIFEDVTDMMGMENFVPTRVMCVEGRYYSVPVFGVEDYNVCGLTVGYGNTVGAVIEMVGGDDKWTKGMLKERD